MRYGKWLGLALAFGAAVWVVCPASAATRTLDWTDNATNETGTRIERRAGRADVFVEIATVGENVVTYVDTTAPDDGEVCYRVRAYNAGGNSAYSNEACFGVTRPPTPTGVRGYE